MSIKNEEEARSKIRKLFEQYWDDHVEYGGELAMQLAKLSANHVDTPVTVKVDSATSKELRCTMTFNKSFTDDWVRLVRDELDHFVRERLRNQ